MTTTAGQLGLGDEEDRDRPTRVGGDSDWASVAAADEHTLAVKRDGTLWAWGKQCLRSTRPWRRRGPRSPHARRRRQRLVGSSGGIQAHARTQAATARCSHGVPTALVNSALATKRTATAPRASVTTTTGHWWQPQAGTRSPSGATARCSHGVSIALVNSASATQGPATAPRASVATATGHWWQRQAGTRLPSSVTARCSHGVTTALANSDSASPWPATPHARRRRQRLGIGGSRRRAHARPQTRWNAVGVGKQFYGQLGLGDVRTAIAPRASAATSIGRQ